MQPDAAGRPEPEPAADEATTLTQFLDWQRATLAWKCAGLSDEDLRRTLAPSTMTLGGLLGHLARVEDSWFSQHFLGAAPRWPDLRRDNDRDAAWHLPLAGDELRSLWQEAVEASRRITADALAAGGLDTPAVRGQQHLRWILVHMIEEYARHNGHADLIRESIDGQRGE